jgi:hypothetical protein
VHRRGRCDRRRRFGGHEIDQHLGDARVRARHRHGGGRDEAEVERQRRADWRDAGERGAIDSVYDNPSA